jgi:hypothetical protein
MMKQLQMMPAYRHGEEFYERLPCKGTPVLDHVPVRGWGLGPKSIYDARSDLIKRGMFARPTMYSTVDAVIRPTHPEVEALYPRASGTESIDAEELAGLAIECLRDYVAAQWNPKAKHVIMCSSGYDTRLLLALLPKDLGKTRLCCFQPEIADARAIVEHLGLSEWFYPIDADADPVDYYAECLDFNTIGREFSESERFWGGPLLIQLRLGDWLDDNVQGFSALFADETGKWNRLHEGDVARFLGVYHFDNPGVLPGRGDIEFVYPFVSLGWLRLLTKYYMPIKLDAFKVTMLKLLDPELAEFPNWRFQARFVREKNGGHIDQQKISPTTARAMGGSYRASWYYKTTKRECSFSDCVMKYRSPQNQDYIKAAIFEHHRRVS